MSDLYNYFISYNRRDAEIARQLADAMSINGIPYWFAESEILIRGRNSIRDENILKSIIIDAANVADYCLYLFSNNSISSKWVNEVELPIFINRELKENREIIIPVKIDGIENSLLPNGLGEREVVDYTSTNYLSALLTILLKKAGINKSIDLSYSFLHSKDIDIIWQTVTTEKREIKFSFEVGKEWYKAGKLSSGMLFIVRNSETDVLLNLMVGIDPAQVSSERNVCDIETDNYFAETYVYGKESFKVMFDAVRKSKKTQGKYQLVKYFLLNKIFEAVLPERKVLGSHVFNVNNSPHFAFTYTMRDMVFRKYSILYLPPLSDKYFEFVFTASYCGEYSDFLARISRVDKIVRSFKIAS